MAHHVKTIAFPPVSCGAYGYPIDQAAKVAIQEIVKFLSANPSVEKVYISCFTEEVYDAYVAALQR